MISSSASVLSIVVYLFVFIGPSLAESRICRNKRTGAIVVRERCRSTETRVNSIVSVNPTPAPTATPSNVFVGTFRVAKTDTATKSSARLGSEATTASFAEAEANFNPYSAYRITLNGEFSGLSATTSEANENKFIVTSTARSFDFGVTNANVVSATSSRVIIDVFVWKSSDSTTVPPIAQSDVYVTVHRIN